MQRVECTGDDRNKGWCVFCGGPDESEDHVPSRVFLDRPHPDNPPTVSSCYACNNSFSRDEAYMACLMECALSGSIAAAAKRPKIAELLQHSPALAARLSAARYDRNGQVGFEAEVDRIRTVVLKLARGHVAFEQNEPQLDEPTAISFVPLTAMDTEQVAAFEAVRQDRRHAWPEVGSRAFTRAVFAFGAGNHPETDGCWVVVQPGNYRYRVEWGGECRVQMVFREYLAAEVVWKNFPDQ